MNGHGVSAPLNYEGISGSGMANPVIYDALETVREAKDTGRVEENREMKAPSISPPPPGWWFPRPEIKLPFS